MGRKINECLSFLMLCSSISDMIILSYLIIVRKRRAHSGGRGGVPPVNADTEQLGSSGSGYIQETGLSAAVLSFQGFSKIKQNPSGGGRTGGRTDHSFR